MARKLARSACNFGYGDGLKVQYADNGYGGGNGGGYQPKPQPYNPGNSYDDGDIWS